MMYGYTAGKVDQNPLQHEGNPVRNAIQRHWVNNHEVRHQTYDGNDFVQCIPVVCRDGFKVSVQASSTHYCEPRTYVEDGSYTAWELGFPSDADELIARYAETPDDPTQTVYGWVPTDTINALIAKHGGLK